MKLIPKELYDSYQNGFLQTPEDLCSDEQRKEMDSVIKYFEKLYYITQPLLDLNKMYETGSPSPEVGASYIKEYDSRKKDSNNAIIHYWNERFIRHQPYTDNIFILD